METYIIYLAAGNSLRFGSNKLLYKIGGKELYRYGLDNLIKLSSIRSDCKLIVVTQYFEIITTYPELNYIYSAKCHEGLSYSIKAGIEMIDKQNDFQILFVVADQIYLNYQTLNKMLDAFNNSNYSLASMIYQGQAGNPTIFNAAYIEELMKLEGDQGGRKIINQYQDKCLFYQIENELELLDIDKLEDLDNIHNNRMNMVKINGK